MAASASKKIAITNSDQIDGLQLETSLHLASRIAKLLTNVAFCEQANVNVVQRQSRTELSVQTIELPFPKHLTPATLRRGLWELLTRERGGDSGSGPNRRFAVCPVALFAELTPAGHSCHSRAFPAAATRILPSQKSASQRVCGVDKTNSQCKGHALPRGTTLQCLLRARRYTRRLVVQRQSKAWSLW